MKFIPSLSICLLLGFFLYHPPVQAQSHCNCDSTASWADTFEKSNVVFLGTCIGVRSNPIKGGMNIIFSVDSSWKRKIEPSATVHTKASNQCGYLFEEGKRYIVFGNKHHQTLETSICEPNQDFAENGRLTLRRLGKGFSPGRPEFGRKMIFIMIVLGVVSLLFVLLVVLRKRLFKKKQMV
ncbi:MAG TPA: hypothetical protein ENJ82_07960 [Bacteroidetes bacterium]|nr:hypothetical protein [Bacteroidota bacterium]